MNDSPVDCQNRGGAERRSVRIIRPYNYLTRYGKTLVLFVGDDAYIVP